MIEYKEGAILFSSSNDWYNKVETKGKGRSYGIEFLLRKNKGSTTGWISYYISRTERQFNSINKGNPFLYKYDKTHDISIVFNQKLNKNISISSTWVFSSGSVITLAVAKYDLINFDYNNQSESTFIMNEAHIYQGRNSYRLPPYHRLDIGVNYEKQTKIGVKTWSIGVYNVYNRKNPYYVFFKPVNNTYKLYQQSLFPIIPSISYSFKF